MAKHPYNLTGVEFWNKFGGHKKDSKVDCARYNRILAGRHIKEEISMMEDDSDLLPLWHDDVIGHNPKPKKFYKKNEIRANKKSYFSRKMEQDYRRYKLYRDPFPWSGKK